MRKKLFIVIVILSIIVIFMIFFFKGPIITRQQALYFGCKQMLLQKDWNMDYKELNELDLKALKNSEMEKMGFSGYAKDDTWWVVNRQIYDPEPGIMGGGIGVMFTKDRKNVKAFIWD